MRKCRTKKDKLNLKGRAPSDFYTLPKSCKLEDLGECFPDDKQFRIIDAKDAFGTVAKEFRKQLFRACKRLLLPKGELWIQTGNKQPNPKKLVSTFVKKRGFSKVMMEKTTDGNIIVAVK